jgi:PAS domain S-box-containing protein
VHNAQETYATDQASVPEAQPRSAKPDIRVLHVDDDKNHLLFTKMFLEQDGRISVDQTDNPKEAMRRVADGHYDCLVTDYQMPGMDGIQLSHAIRESQDIPIIIYTGQGSEEVAEEAFKTGINDYLRKELNPSHYMVLAKRIEAVVESRRGHKQLIESERRLRETLDQMLEGCQIIDHEYRYLYLNKAAVRQAHKGREDLIGRSMMECYPGIEDTEMFRSLTTCMDERVPINMENQFIYPDGSKTWYTLSMEPVPEGVFILSIDINDRKEAENELRDKEKTLRNTFRASPHALFITDLNGVIMDCNKNAINMLNCPDTQELIGRSYTEFIHPSDLERANVNQEETIKRGLFKNLEYCLVDYLGNTIPVLVSVSVVYNDDGSPGGFVAAVENITERVKNMGRMRSLLLHSVELCKCRTLEEVYMVTQRTMEQTLGFHRPDILIKRGDHLVHLVHLVGSSGLPSGFKIPLNGAGLTVKAFKEKKTVNENDVRSSPLYLQAVNEVTGEPYLGYESTRSELCCPILVEDEAVGVLNVESPLADYFTENDQLMLQILASHVAEAIKRVDTKR